MKKKLMTHGVPVALALAGALMPLTASGAATLKHPKLYAWYHHQGGKQSMDTIEADMSGVGTAVDESSDGDYSGVGDACQTLADDVLIAQNLPPEPFPKLQRLWSRALTAFENGANACVSGVDDNDSSEIDQAVSYFSTGTALINRSTAELGKI